MSLLESFPVFRDVLATLANWSPKLNSVLSKFNSYFSMGTWKITVSGYSSLVVDSYYPIIAVYVKIWRLVFVIMQVHKITLSGSAQIWMLSNIPIPIDPSYKEANFFGRGENGGSTIQLLGYSNGGTDIAVQTHDAATWTTGADRSFSLSGFYIAKE